MIELSMMTREITYLLVNVLLADGVKLELKEDGDLTNQTHVDFISTNAELNVTLDDFSERVLMPAANALKDRLIRGKASYCYKFKPSHSKVYDYSIQTYDGICIRGLVDRKYLIYDDEGNEVITNLFRFDIRWSV